MAIKVQARRLGIGILDRCVMECVERLQSGLALLLLLPAQCTALNPHTLIPFRSPALLSLPNALDHCDWNCTGLEAACVCSTISEENSRGKSSAPMPMPFDEGKSLLGESSKG